MTVEESDLEEQPTEQALDEWMGAGVDEADLVRAECVVRSDVTSPFVAQSRGPNVSCKMPAK